MIDSLRLRQVKGLIIATARLRYPLLQRLHSEGVRIILILHDHRLDDSAGLVGECTSWSGREGARALRELLDNGPAFTGVVAGNDLLALGCYDVLGERGMGCRSDLSVVAPRTCPTSPLTCVRVPHYDVGAVAAAHAAGQPAGPALAPRGLWCRR